MRILAILALALALTGCLTLSRQIDETTGTTKAERCADYQALLATAAAVQETKPTEARAERIKLYRALIAANCPEVK